MEALLETAQADFFKIMGYSNRAERVITQIRTEINKINLLSNDYTIDNLVILGLSPDTSKNKTVNYILLLARFYIWLCRSKENIPTIENLKPFLKQYKKEIEPFCIW